MSEEVHEDDAKPNTAQRFASAFRGNRSRCHPHLPDGSTGGFREHGHFRGGRRRKRTGPGSFAATVYGALAASKPFLAESAGFTRRPSDGLDHFDASHALTSQYQSADDGNVALTALVNAAPGTPFTLALGFGSTAVRAINLAERSSVQPFGNTLERYLAGWRRYDSTLRPPPNSLPGLSAAADAAMGGNNWLSANVLKADEDKTYPGAFVASPTDPWGQSVPATTTHPGSSLPGGVHPG